MDSSSILNSGIKQQYFDETKTHIIRLIANAVISIIGSLFLFKVMPKFKDMFMKADLKGTDLSKKEKYQM
jgi:hypothetical protein